MIYVVVSVFDSASAAYMRPFYGLAVGQAVRVFGDEVNRRSDDNPMFSHPEDFALFKVGFFDDSNGSMVAVSPPERLASAVDFKTPI